MRTKGQVGHRDGERTCGRSELGPAGPQVRLPGVVEDLDTWLQANETKPWISDPSCPQTSFNHRWTDDQYRVFRDKIHKLAPKIRTAYDAGTPSESISAWQDVFGPDFPSALTAKASATSPTKRTWTPPSSRAPGEVFIEEKFPVTNTHHAVITSEIARGRGIGPRDGH